MKNIFKQEIVEEVINRINELNSSSKNLWGKMKVSQMLAHCNVTYDMIYTDKYPKPNAFKKFMLKLFVKKIVVGEKPYSKNGRTAPEFLITDEKEFENEKIKLIENITKTYKLGEKHFEGKQSHSFGTLTASEWNNMFYKHLDHHLNQFGV